jgi:hypothetical protein
MREAWTRLETKVIGAGWGIYGDALRNPGESEDERNSEWEEEPEE